MATQNDGEILGSPSGNGGGLGSGPIENSITNANASNVLAGSSEVCRVSVRIPPFWPDDPEVWFAQVESQFILSGITQDSTKFHFVSCQLEQEYARIVKDVIAKPPPTGRYDKLKLELIRRISASREKKTLQLMQHEELGDRKPTEFLRHLRHLAGPNMPDDFIRTVWSSRLPPHVQPIVASQRRVDLDEVAELADQICDVVQPSHVVASTSVSVPAASVAPWEARIEELSRQVEALVKVQSQNRPFQRNFNRRNRSRSNSQPRHRQRSRSREYPEGHSYCWYHFQFGPKAKKCSDPCTYNSGNETGSH